MKNQYSKHSELQDSILNEPQAIYMPSIGISLEPLNMIRSAREGITMAKIHALAKQLSLSMKDLASILHLSLRTIQRYGTTKRLDADSSAKAIQLALLQHKGIEVFGDATDFSEWLHSIVPSLDGQRPIDYLDTPFGFDLVEQMLGRIDHGIFA